MTVGARKSVKQEPGRRNRQVTNATLRAGKVNGHRLVADAATIVARACQARCAWILPVRHLYHTEPAKRRQRRSKTDTCRQPGKHQHNKNSSQAHAAATRQIRPPQTAAHMLACPCSEHANAYMHQHRASKWHAPPCAPPKPGRSHLQNQTHRLQMPLVQPAWSVPQTQRSPQSLGGVGAR